MKLKMLMASFACGILMFFACTAVQSAQATIEAIGTYTMPSGMEESFADAEEFAREEARRSAIEQAAVYVKSESSVHNEKLTHDEIQAIAAGVLRIQEEEISRELIGARKDIKFIVKIKATIDTDNANFRQLLQNYAMRAEIVQQYQSLSSMYEEEKKSNEELKASFAKNQTDDEKTTQEIHRLRAKNGIISQIRHFREGFDLHNTARYEEAVQEFLKVIDLNPENGDAYMAIGDNCDHLGKNEEVLQYYLKALEYPVRQKDTLYNNIGMKYSRMNEPEKGLLYFLEAVKLAPHNGFYRVNLGRCYHSLSDYASAVKEFSMALEKAPWNSTALCDRGVSYYFMGEYELSLNDFQQATKLRSDAIPYGWIGNCYLALGQFSEALPSYRRALELADENTYATNPVLMIRVYIGQAYSLATQGQLQEALDSIQRALCLEPENEQALEIREAILAHML